MAPVWGKDTLLIERMSAEGRGVASREGKIVFVAGALAGEQALVQCTAVKRDYDEADMIGLADDTAPSPSRVSPPCPVYAQCGGCSLQHWAPAAQQQHKQARLQAMLRPAAPALIPDPPITSDPSGFRHRLRLAVTREGDGSYAFGLRGRRSHDVVRLRHCLVANEAINALLQALPGILSTAPALQGLREIELDADSNGHTGLCLYFAAHPGERTLSALAAAVLAGPAIALRVRLNTQRTARDEGAPDESGGDDIGSWRELYAAGELCLLAYAQGGPDADAGQPLRLAYLPGDFTQTQWEVNTALVSRALDWLQPAGDERALDLFCGIGNFSLPLARHAGTVHALEGDSGMTRRVAANAQRNGMGNISARTLNLMTPGLALPAADIAIVDPPRAGAKVVCEALAGSAVRRLVYVSCHPATLLRDAQVLHRAGFRLARAAAVDMFPHTGHSEAIALFQR